MNEVAPSVPDLVARFALRRRATTDSFSEGVRLASAGAVVFGEMSDGRVSAFVRDPLPFVVTLVAQGDALLGECECPDGEGTVCPHQVAAAHAVWSIGREHGPNGKEPEPDSDVLTGDCGIVLRTMHRCPDDPRGPRVCACGAEIIPQQLHGDR